MLRLFDTLWEHQKHHSSQLTQQLASTSLSGKEIFLYLSLKKKKRRKRKREKLNWWQLHLSHRKGETARPNNGGKKGNIKENKPDNKVGVVICCVNNYSTGVPFAELVLWKEIYLLKSLGNGGGRTQKERNWNDNIFTLHFFRCPGLAHAMPQPRYPEHLLWKEAALCTSEKKNKWQWSRGLWRLLWEVPPCLCHENSHFQT